MSLLALEPALLSRLREALPRTVHVLPLPDLEQVAAGRVQTPAVCVAYAGGSVGDSRPDGRAVRVSQRWNCVIIVRNAAATTSGAPAREDVGAIADAVLGALLGWTPDGFAPLALVALPVPGYVSGLMWLPLTFEEVRLVVAEP